MIRAGYGNPKDATRRRALRAEEVRGFNFTSHMHAILADMAARLPELAHIAPDQVAVSFAQARKRVRHGLCASLTPMRFERGRRTTIRRGRRCQSQRLLDRAGREMLYILRFYLPRFLDAPFHEKIVTVLHELWHISPEFDGDLRRFQGRCRIHTHSQKKYDGRMRQLADRYLALSPPSELLAPLDCSFDQLQKRYGRVYGTKIPHPKLIPAE